MTVTIVIPVLDNAKHLAACLDQVVAQDYPHSKIEVIVADGGSIDGSVDVAERFPMGSIRKRVICVGSRGRAQGLNAAIRASQSDAICRLDARTRVRSNYITQCVDTMLATGAANVGGVQMPWGDKLIQKAIGEAMSHPFGVGNARFRIAKQSGFVDTVYLGFFRKEIFDTVGLFDEDAAVISEDSDMNQRIRNAGGKIYLNTTIQAEYQPREAMSAQFSLYYRYGGARAGNVLKHGNFTSLRQIVPGSFVALLLGLGVAAAFNSAARFGLAGLSGVYAACSVVAASKIAMRRHDLRYFPLTVVAFVAMHVGFGLGFWARLLSKPRSGKYWGG